MGSADTSRVVAIPEVEIPGRSRMRAATLLLVERPAHSHRRVLVVYTAHSLTVVVYNTGRENKIKFSRRLDSPLAPSSVVRIRGTTGDATRWPPPNTSLCRITLSGDVLSVDVLVALSTSPLLGSGATNQPVNPRCIAEGLVGPRARPLKPQVSFPPLTPPTQTPDTPLHTPHR